MSDVEQQIVEIIETRVRPSVAMDGGDIIYRGVINLERMRNGLASWEFVKIPTNIRIFFSKNFCRIFRPGN